MKKFIQKSDCVGGDAMAQATGAGEGLTFSAQIAAKQQIGSAGLSSAIDRLLFHSKGSRAGNGDVIRHDSHVRQHGAPPLRHRRS